MMHSIVLFAILATFQIACSLPLQEEITPVDLSYSCLRVTSGENDQDKIPVLLIHGVSASHKSWDGVSLTIALNTEQRVCSVDLRNHGDSPWTERTDVKSMVVDIEHFLDKQDIKKVDIIGHSLGGQISMEFALNNPNRVNSLVVEDMRPYNVTNEAYSLVMGAFAVLKEAISAIPAGVTEEQARDTIADFLNKNLNQTEKFTGESISFLELKLVDEKWLFKFNIDVLLEAMKDTEAFFGKSTGVYNGPALFIYGDKSPFKVGEYKENILKLFPEAKLVPVKGAEHVIHGNFLEFNEEVIKFLKEVN